MDLKDLSTRKCENRAFTARSFISSCFGLSNPCTTSTNPVTDLHFGCIDHLDYDKYENTQMHI